MTGAVFDWLMNEEPRGHQGVQDPPLYSIFINDNPFPTSCQTGRLNASVRPRPPSDSVMIRHPQWNVPSSAAISLTKECLSLPQVVNGSSVACGTARLDLSA